MAHTNSTTNYALPQFITTDKPAWLTDVNNAFLAIDTGMNNAQTAANNAQGDATQALSDASGAATAAAAASAKGDGALASIEAPFDSTTIYSEGAKVIYNNLLYRCTVAVVTPGPWTGAANWERITVDSIIPGSAGSLPITPGSGVMTSTAIENTTKVFPESVTPIESTRFNYLSISRMGNLKMLIFREPKGFNPNSESNADYVLPEDLRPREEVRVDFTVPGSSDYIRVRVRVNGNITVYNYSTNTSVINANGIIPFF